MYFISYSWVDSKPDPQVLQLVNNLRSIGYEIECDVMKIQHTASIDFVRMMDESFQKAEKIIVILSPEYKRKADSYQSGVGTEYEMIVNDMRDHPKKYILATFETPTKEKIEEICPAFFKGREIIQITYPLEKCTLLYRMSDTSQYIFSEVNEKKFIPIPEIVGGNAAVKKVIDEEKADSECEEAIPSGFDECSNSTALFDFRLRQAFPGIRGLKIFDDPKICVDRLEILLRSPLKSREMTDPIWYFRGSSCMNIESFERLSDTKCLINCDEYEIDKVAVYVNPGEYYREFLYIQTKPDVPSGVYEMPDDLYNNPQFDYAGYYYEEFGMCGDVPITRTEYDDGAAIINGKVVQSGSNAENFKLRLRYLTPYNLVLCAKFHPFNSSKGDELSKKYLNNLLKDKCTLEDFVQASRKLPRGKEIY